MIVEIDHLSNGVADVYVEHNGISMLMCLPDNLMGRSCAEQAVSAEHVSTIACTLVQEALTEWINDRIGVLDS